MKHYLIIMPLMFFVNYVYGDADMELIDVEPFNVIGIEISTTNELEMNSSDPKIPGLWESFYTKHYGKSLNGNPIYGVYSDYESDVNGQYSVLAGIKAQEANSSYKVAKVKGGKYLVFRSEGDPSKAVVLAWQKVWEYFSNKNNEYERAYTSDFEVYEGVNSVSIYIAVK
ncbi:GyrI-like domain-containing protein [Aurantivibrio infirmus]